MPVILAIVVGLALLLALLPLAVLLRIRGAFNTRRQAWVLPLRLAWWSSLISALLFTLSTLLAGLFWPNVWQYVPLALVAGLLLGWVGRSQVRWMDTDQGLFYRTSPVLSVLLTLLVVGRLIAGLVQGVRVASGAASWPEAGWLSHAGMMAVGALLLGYALVVTRHLYRKAAQLRRSGGVLRRR